MKFGHKHNPYQLSQRDSGTKKMNLKGDTYILFICTIAALEVVAFVFFFEVLSVKCSKRRITWKNNVISRGKIKLYCCILLTLTILGAIKIIFSTPESPILGEHHRS